MATRGTRGRGKGARAVRGGEADGAQRKSRPSQMRNEPTWFTSGKAFPQEEANPTMPDQVVDVVHVETLQRLETSKGW